MVQMPIVHRHFAGIIEFVVVDDDLRVQFCRQARSGMKQPHVVHRAIIGRPDIGGHLIRVRILPAVEPDVRLRPRTHYKEE